MQLRLQKYRKKNRITTRSLLGCTGLYWAIKVSSGMHWAVLGCIELCWAVLGCTGLYWAALGSSLSLPGCASLYQAVLDCNWDVLDCTGLYWTLQICIGQH